MASQSSIDIVPLQPEYRQSIINLLMSSFFLQEPLNEMLKFDIPHEPLSWVDYIIDEALRDNCSFVAIDTAAPHNQLVGVIINGISNRNDPHNNFEMTSEKLKFVFSLIDQVLDGYNLFDMYKTDRLFHCDIINIDENQRGQNLSTHLIAASLDQARKLHLKGGFVVCSSLFSRKAFVRNGFHVINELLYSNHPDERLKQMGIHDRCTLLGKQF